jgi:hypothetical protein
MNLTREITCLLMVPFLFIGPVANAAEFRVKKNKIIMTGDIEHGDRDRLHRLLKKGPGVKTISLTSPGGSMSEAADLADLIIDFKLDTHVIVKCESACASYVQLAGSRRTMERGSKIGYHRSQWNYDKIKDAYKSAPEDFDHDIFKFAIWIDEIAVDEIFRDLKYLLERGVSANFAIRTLQAEHQGMWNPRRTELIASGVLTE